MTIATLRCGIAAVLSALVLVSNPSRAQTPARTMPDSAQMAGAMANAMRMQRPAEYVLDFKEELALTPEQVGLLTNIAKMHRDSAEVRRARVMEMMTAASLANRATMTAMAWSGPVDEAAIRAEACKQAGAQVELTLAMIRDRHAVGEALTDLQKRRLPMIEANAMMKGMKAPPR